MSEQRAPLMPFEETAILSLPAAALAYANAGIPVFPCWPGAKTPATEHGFYDATTDPDQVTAWWQRLPEANIAVATGDRVNVLDIDAHATGTGYPVLQRLHRAGLIDGWAHAVRTPGSGLHLYYPADPAGLQGSWSRGSSHVDFRGTGGYIVTVPSRIQVAGMSRTYAPIGGSHLDTAPLDAERIRDLLTPTPPPRPTPGPAPADTAGRVASLRTWLSGAVEGNRNAALFWAASRMVDLGASEAETLTQLGGAAAHTGLGEREIATTIHSAHRTADSGHTTATVTPSRHVHPGVWGRQP